MSTLGIVVLVLWLVAASLAISARFQNGRGPSAGFAGVLLYLSAGMLFLASLIVLAYNHGF